MPFAISERLMLGYWGRSVTWQGRKGTWRKPTFVSGETWLQPWSTSYSRLLQTKVPAVLEMAAGIQAAWMAETMAFMGRVEK